MKDQYDIEVATKPLPAGYAYGGALVFAGSSGRLVIRGCDKAACAVWENPDLATQVTAAELDAAIERARARRAAAERPIEQRLELDGLEDDTWPSAGGRGAI